MDADRDGAGLRAVIGLGGSAGGIEVMRRILAELPEDLPAALCVVLHIPATQRSFLAAVLRRGTALEVRTARQGERLRPGRVYVAPPDFHLLVRGLRVELSHGPKENAVRPAVDPLLRSLGASLGPAAIGVVVSGALDDGASGARALARAGGTVVVQEPADALVPGMPAAALATVPGAHAVPAVRLAGMIVELTQEHEPISADETEGLEVEKLEVTGNRPDGPATGFTCPECHGGLWELRDGDLVRYRCRVGHTYNQEALLEEQRAAVEAALWAALEVLEERVELIERVRDRATVARVASRLDERVRRTQEHADMIRLALAAGMRSAEAPEAVE